MDEYLHPSVDQVIAIHGKVIAKSGGSDDIRDKGLLESAVAAPQATMFGVPIFQDGVEIAAAYLFYLCQNHPFIDGNKRVALATSLVFLSINGLLSETRLHEDTWLEFTLDVASSKYDRDGVTTRLRELLSK
ncbi:MAG: type II toxin-antitoxin system death-on-curing family toxin [Opitutales bacterium]|nr:type II toxin-antitoxin system death-on-curing family toxin [Opitutales bacterium]MDP4776712.1 type II toxin-antitoxin system death-on-curing family toxin [Opitutales bacterium]MDP5079403.1 type II toxin-antitoxin system death-on-curing family toxin [Opitutales bacterium]